MQKDFGTTPAGLLARHAFSLSCKKLTGSIFKQKIIIHEDKNKKNTDFFYFEASLLYVHCFHAFQAVRQLAGQIGLTVAVGLNG